MRRWPAIALALGLAACSGANHALDAASDQNEAFLDIWNLMMWVCGLAYVLVLAFLAWTLWRSRRHMAPAESSSPGMGAALAGWTAFIVVGLTVLVVTSYLVDARMAAASPGDVLKIRVVAAQWWWRVEYPGSQAAETLTTANEIHLPSNRPVEIELISDDVIHSFWVPNLGGKTDLIPGRTNVLKLTPRREGEYRGQCAEFCGLQHAFMVIDAVVQSPDAFAAWKAAQLAPASAPASEEARRGQAIFLGGACKACHRVVGTGAMGATGPDLTHFGSRKWIAAGTRPNTSKDLRDWLTDPQAVKPGNHMPVVALDAGQVDDLVAYLRGLK